MEILPVSAVAPTRNRTAVFRATLASLGKQGLLPAELIVVDASAGGTTRDMLHGFRLESGCAWSLRWMPAEVVGAAAQRNQGVALATQPFIWFFDDDILFEPECVNRLWRAMQSDTKLGGVSAMIVNQKYHPPGIVSRMMLTLLHGRRENTFAGRVIGPAINLLPEDRDDLPEVVPVEWLNTTCTIYRRGALPSPPFDSVFTGYSLMEDLTLSLRVGRNWRLANDRTARIFHDSQPGTYKSNVSEMAAMELVNRHYVMTKVLGRTGLVNHLRLILWEVFHLAACVARAQSRPTFWAMWQGKWRAMRVMAAGRRKAEN